MRKLPVIFFAICLLGVTSYSYASVIALSQMEIRDFLVVPETGGITFSNNISSPNNDGPSGSIARAAWYPQIYFTDVMDAPLACLGPACSSIGQNDFQRQIGGSFVRGDSEILDLDFAAGTAAFRLIAETRDFATSSGGVDPFGIFDIAIPFKLDTPTSLNLSFHADVFQESILTAGGPGSGAIADSFFEIRIITPNCRGYNCVDLNWVEQPFQIEPYNSLALPPTPSAVLHDPTGDGFGGTAGLFKATTGSLTSGTEYELWIRANVRVGGSVQRDGGPEITPVPEPSTFLFLFGGVAGLLFLRKNMPDREA